MIAEKKYGTKKELELRIKELEKEIENTEGTKCEVYSRIVGYHRPVENWNDGKKDEFYHRQDYKESVSDT
ncbi:hypothetical protein Flexsi_0776 [Flexistipes sinusarabici DSM 4947]|uniref:Uncharacterized protein n=1 Tax=Flexistipes sinusarabici (strain ATCC 49648 / DSM 4947 / MAS 10) TaxID=717231 RepID=F8E4G0_FLESM|nr:anaerobic ribonucleoside-triphosphate reductase [Flexistipes sinusarabici]AEI14446.1 hypothetical protein Flexsi_0776 [Flexistipes sinusarabici DSM 4947]